MRFFIEVTYMGTRYAGFQMQPNALTIQAELEKALHTIYRQPIALTGSSRTDAGVHAMQNFFQADVPEGLLQQRHVYNLNALLPADIAIRRMYAVPHHWHCRFMATHRLYHYHLYHFKNPMLADRGWYYPFPLDAGLLQQAADILLQHTDFTSFSKRNTQTKTMLCNITHSQWHATPTGYRYEVQANRFLRGMVRGLVGTMLQVGRQRISLQDFREIIEARDCTRADFSTPAHGLFLMEVGLPPAPHN